MREFLHEAVRDSLSRVLEFLREVVDDRNECCLECIVHSILYASGNGHTKVVHALFHTRYAVNERGQCLTGSMCGDAVRIRVGECFHEDLVIGCMIAPVQVRCICRDCLIHPVEPFLRIEEEDSGTEHTGNRGPECRAHTSEQRVDAPAYLFARVGVELAQCYGKSDEGSEDTDTGEDIRQGVQYLQVDPVGCSH